MISIMWFPGRGYRQGAIILFFHIGRPRGYLIIIEDYDRVTYWYKLKKRKNRGFCGFKINIPLQGGTEKMGREPESVQGPKRPIFR